MSQSDYKNFQCVLSLVVDKKLTNLYKIIKSGAIFGKVTKDKLPEGYSLTSFKLSGVDNLFILIFTVKPELIITQKEVNSINKILTAINTELKDY